jgi:hypothetical protein
LESDDEEVPGSEEERLDAEGDGGGGEGCEPLLREDRRGEKEAVDEASGEATEVGGVGDVRDGEAQE